jgi:glycosyltransferase involved in cell wall biosynthesis
MVYHKTHPRIAFVYDWVDKFGGAERLLLSLHRVFPEAPLFTSVYNPKQAPWARDFSVTTSWINRLARGRHEWLMPFLPLAFESFNFDDFDIVVSVSSSFAKGIITKPSTRHVSYVLAPTRYLWQDNDLYRESLGEPYRFFFNLTVPFLRPWDFIAGWRPDSIVTISQHVAGEVEKYYRRPVERVIYPTIDASRYIIGNLTDKKNYFLLVSRLVPYKRIDMAIDAFSRLGCRLLVVGSGSQERRLRSRAKENIEFLGNLSEVEMRRVYREAIALIVPWEEDFGLVALEANASGTPVVAYGRGGCRETIEDHKTGLFFSPQTADALADVIRKTKFRDFRPEDCRLNAERFNFRRFAREWKQLAIS